MTAAEALAKLIRDFEKLPAARRVELAPTLRPKVEALGFSEGATAELLRDVFGPMVRKAQAAQAERRKEAEENPGAVVLRGAAELVAKHPAKLDRPALVEILLGTSRHGRLEDAHGSAEGVPESQVEGLLEAMVAKGVLAEDARGRLSRPGREG